MATLSNITVTKELRLCKIDEVLGYFVCWEEYDVIIFPVIMVYANPVVQYSLIFCIFEFDDRIERVDPTKIQFIDETHNYLHAQKEYLGSFKKSK